MNILEESHMSSADESNESMSLQTSQLASIRDFSVSVFQGMPAPEKVRELETKILQLPQINLHTGHVVHGGMYARTIFIPAGTILTGAKTNVENICILWGDITVTTDEGPKRLVGFTVIPANAGFKRAGIAHTDTYWTTVFPTALTDIQEIEDAVTEESDMLQTRRPGIVFDQRERIEG